MQFYLGDGLVGVPERSHPVYWDRRLRVEDNMMQVEGWMRHYRSRHLPQGANIDEAAILAPDYWHRSKITGQLVEAGWHKTADAEDIVYTNPFGTRYCVEYEFYARDLVPYRLEIMMMVPDRDGVYGFSPLHQALWAPGDNPQDIGRMKYPMPHLSFKPSTMMDEELMNQEAVYKERRRAYCRAVDGLQSSAAIHAMSCQSTYGHFGYYIGNEARRQIYIKPRVNLRDVSQ